MGTGDQVDRLVWSSLVRGGLYVGQYSTEQVYIRQETIRSIPVDCPIHFYLGTLLLIRGGLAELL